MESGNKTIAKNTAFLYVRMLIVLLVSLYTSRVILQTLGIDDNGLYATVGGIVGFLSFLNGALSSATSRFITFALGKGDPEELQKTFAATMASHLAIGLLIVLLAETVGLYYIYHVMVIPPERFDAAIIVFHLSVLTSFILIIQVPFSAEVIAHERMSVFAYLGIFEVLAKLGIAYSLAIGHMDKLILFAILQLLLNISLYFFYLLYCRESFPEISFKVSVDKKLFGSIFKYSGWSLFTNGAIALSNQGIILLLNLFFAPAVVTARSISLQVNSAASHFVSNFRTAVNPQIVKKYAAGDFSGSKILMLESTKFSFFLMLLIALPICLLAQPILDLWLVEVPEYTATFLQIVIIQSLFQVFNLSFFTAISATGRIRDNAIVTPIILMLCFPVVYFLFKAGASPVALSWAYLIGEAVLGLIAKPMILVKIAGYHWGEILRVFWSCIKVTLVALPIPLLLYFKLGNGTLLNCFIIGFASVLCVTLAAWTLGFTKEMRKKLIEIVWSRFRIV